MAVFPTALRGWLLFTSAFELPLIYNCIKNGKLEGLYQNLQNTGAAKRLVAFALSALVTVRLAAAADIENVTLQWQNAAVHVLEAIYFGREMLILGPKGKKEMPILCIIFLQALCYCIWAIRSQK